MKNTISKITLAVILLLVGIFAFVYFSDNEEAQVRDENENFGEIEVVSIMADYENETLMIAGEVSQEVDQVVISALRWVDENNYENSADRHQPFILEVVDLKFKQEISKGESWAGGTSWHGLRPGLHQIRVEIVNHDGEVVHFMDSNEFFVEGN